MKPVPYDLNPKLDSNIVDSQNNLDNTEKKLGTTLKLAKKQKTAAHAQVKKNSDPPCNSADGCETRHYKGEGEDDSVKYKTNQPLDHDIKATHASLKDAEKSTGKKMKMTSNLQVESESGIEIK